MVPLPSEEARRVMLEKLLPPQRACDLNYGKGAKRIEVRF